MSEASTFRAELARSGAAFRAGFSHRGLATLVGFVVALGTTFWLGEQFASQWAFQWIPGRFFLRDHVDDVAHLAPVLADVQRRPPPALVVVVGSSATRESLSDDATLEAALTKQLPSPPKVRKFASSSQSLEESLAIVDALPRTSGLVLVGLSPDSFARRLKDRQEWISRAALWPYSAEVARLRGEPWHEVVVHQSRSAGFTQHLRGLLSTLPTRPKDETLLQFFHDFRWPDRRYVGHVYDDAKPPSAEEFARYDREVREELVPGFRRDVDYNQRVLARLVAVAQDKGYRVAFFDSPMSPRSLDAHGPVLADYDRAVDAVANERTVPVWRFGRTLGLPNDAYYDFHHLLPPGRKVFEERFVSEIAGTFGVTR